MYRTASSLAISLIASEWRLADRLEGVVEKSLLKAALGKLLLDFRVERRNTITILTDRFSETSPEKARLRFPANNSGSILLSISSQMSLLDRMLIKSRS
jgi:hypothetical protein